MNLRHYKLLLLQVMLLLLPIVTLAQTDTFYFDKSWQECDPEIAAYHRVCNVNIGGDFLVKDYYKNWVLYCEGKYKVNKSQDLRSISANSYRNGHFSYYNTDGLLVYSGKYKKGEKDGIWEYYNSNKKLRKKKEFDRNVLKETLCFNTMGLQEKCAGTIYTYVDNMPKANYPVAQYLNNNLVYPESAKKENIEGKVIVSFIIDEDGDIYDVRSQSKNENLDLQKEAIRVISKMPSWKPGHKDGAPVAVSYALPVSFKITYEYKADTFYFDKRWRTIVKGHADMEYYRVVRHKKTNNEPFMVKDYYRTGELKMVGSYYVGDIKLLDKPEANIFRSGLFTSYYKSGRKKREGIYSYGQEDGAWISYYDNDSSSIEDVLYYKLGKRDSVWKFYNEIGVLVRVESYKNDKKHGVWKDYYENGELKQLEESDNGFLVGELKRYYDNGEVARRLIYKNGKLDDQECFSSMGVMEECDENEVPNDYTGMDAMYMIPFVYDQDVVVNEVEVNNFRLKKTEGRVIVELAVDEEGYIVDIKSRSPEADVPLQIKAIKRAVELPDPKAPLLTIEGEPQKVFFRAAIVFVSYY